MKHLSNEQLWDLVTQADELSEDEVRTRFKNSDTSLREYQILMDIHRDLKTLESEVPSMGFSHRVVSRLEKEERLEQRSGFWLRFARNAIFASILLAVVSSIAGASILAGALPIPIDNEVLFTLLVGCGMLWGLFFLDRIFGRIFSRG